MQAGSQQTLKVLWEIRCEGNGALIFPIDPIVVCIKDLEVITGHLGPDRAQHVVLGHQAGAARLAWHLDAWTAACTEVTSLAEVKPTASCAHT